MKSFRILSCGSLVVATLMLLGCSTGVSISERNSYKPNSDISGTIISRKGYTIETRNYIESHNISRRLDDSPDEVINELYQEYTIQQNNRLLEVLCNICYVTGVESDNPEESLKYFVSSAQYAFEYFSNVSLRRSELSVFEPSFFIMTRFYNQSLLNIFEYLYANNSIDNGSYTLPTVDGKGVFMTPPQTTLPKRITEYSDVKPCQRYQVKNLIVNTYQYGLGLPLMAVEDIEELNKGDYIFETPITPVTMRLIFNSDNTAQLAFYPTLIDRYAELLNNINVPLERDLSTPLAYSMSDMNYIRNILSMLNPDEFAGKQGLYLVGNYDPTKIPVILTHGLMSSPKTWVQMVNYLLSDSEIADNYQFIYFFYSTGQPIIYSANQLRSSLQELKKRYDPNNDSEAFKRMVLVGHSMGGVLSKSMIKDGNEELASTILDMPLEKIMDSATPDQQQFISDMLLFKNQDYIERVVFISTPHKGSEIATWEVVKWAAKLISLPTDLITSMTATVEEFLVYTSIKDNNDPVYIATGIDNLDPDNAALIMLDDLPFTGGQPYHSIIANKDYSNVPSGSDGVVPYESSHIENAVSELVVKSGHSAQKSLEAIEEVRRILLLHLESGKESAVSE